MQPWVGNRLQPPAHGFRQSDAACMLSCMSFFHGHASKAGPHGWLLCLALCPDRMLFIAVTDPCAPSHWRSSFLVNVPNFSHPAAPASDF